MGSTNRLPAVCHVVTEDAALESMRRYSPETPIIALVPRSTPELSVLARMAGAEVVLALDDPHAPTSEDDRVIDAARVAACTLATQAASVRETARRASHDLAGVLSAVNLAAELAHADPAASAGLTAQISRLAKAAAADTWLAARPARAGRPALGPVEVEPLLRLVARAHPLATVVSDPSDARVLADHGRLCEAVHELVTNAERAGAERVELGVEHHPNTAELEIVVGDDGCGLPPDPVPRLLRPFLSEWPHRSEGLGLSTVSELTDDLGGRLELAPREASDPRRGTVVRLRLPVLPTPTPRLDPPGSCPDVASAQAAILEGIARQVPLHRSLDEIVAAIESFLPSSVCSVLLLDDERAHLLHGSGPRLPQAYREAIDGVRIGPRRGSCGAAAFTRHPVVAADVTTDERWTDFRDLATEHGLRSCWSTPIMAPEAQEVLGTFAVYHREVWRPDERAVRLVERFTYLAAVAIGQGRLFAALAESESRFRGAFEGAASGMALVALDGRITKVNPALSRMLATPAPQLRGHLLVDLLDEPHGRRLAEDLRMLRRSGGVEPRAVHGSEVSMCVRGTSSPLWVSVTSSLITGESGEPRYYHLEVQDVTARRRSAEERRTREAAEAAHRARSDFLVLVSHELRTPLNAVLGFAQVMQLVDLDPEEHRASAEHMRRAAQHLLGLISDLLDLFGVEAGQLALTLERVPTAEVVREAVEIIAPLADSRSISVRAVLPPHDVSGAALVEGCTPARRDLPLHADRQRVRQVLINLLGNAVKYTPPSGEVRVDVAVVGGRAARICVTDTGPGISERGQAHLFEPYHRLGDGSPGQPEGTGLGLSLTARLVEAMGGTVGVRSRVGEGSTFWVDLPLAVTPPPEDPSGGSGARERADAGEQVAQVERLEEDLVEPAVAR